MNVGLCAIVKNEERDILEWLLFHSAIGFDKIFLFDNESTDKTVANAALAKKYVDLEIVNWPGWPAQESAYNHAAGVIGKNCDWIAFVDIDEFIVPMRDGNIKAYLQSMSGHSAIAVNWLNFGSSGHIEKPAGLIVENFTHRSHPRWHGNRFVKSIIRPAVLKVSRNPHWFKLIAGIDYVNAVGEKLILKPGTGRKSLSIAALNTIRINHYNCKSRLHYADKAAKWQGKQRTHLATDARFNELDRNEVPDVALLSRFKEQISTIRDQCRALGFPVPDAPAQARQISKLAPTGMQRRGSFRRNQSLIFDVGTSEGNDTEYYLSKGFKVVSVEADPIMHKRNVDRFTSEIDAGKLVPLHRASHSESGKILEFWRNKKHQGLSSLTKNENTKFETEQETFEVKSINWEELIAIAGIPHYCKIDIEGGEVEFLRSIKSLADAPQYISAEVHTMAPIVELHRIGYRRFKLVDQKIIKGFPTKNPPLEGSYVAKPNWKHASGPFGRELPGPRWLSYEEVTEAFCMITKLKSYRTALSTWHDCHAWAPLDD